MDGITAVQAKNLAGYSGQENTEPCWIHRRLRCVNVDTVAAPAAQQNAPSWERPHDPASLLRVKLLTSAP